MATEKCTEIVDHPNESKGYLDRACYAQGVRHHHLRLAETQGQAGVGELIVESREGSGLLGSEVAGMGRPEAG